MVTPAELDELERLAAAATPGPWAGDAYHISTADFDVAEYENPADARLAAAAVNALPRLVAEVRRGQKLGALLSAWPECPDCGGDGLGPMYCAGAGESPEQDDCPTCGGLGAVTPWFVRLKARADALVAALRTAEAERLLLARALDRERVRYERGLQLEPQCSEWKLASRIVEEADRG